MIKTHFPRPMPDESAPEGGGGGSASADLDIGKAPAPFYANFQNADLKAAAEKSGYKDVEALFADAHKFAGLKGKDPASLVELPKDAKAEAHLEVLKKLGAPDKPEAYGLSDIEGVDKDLAGAAAGWFQQAGLLPWQAKMVAEAQMAHAKASQEAFLAEEKAGADAEKAALKTEWGGKWDENFALAKRAFKAAGVDEAAMDYLESGIGYAGVLKLGAYFGGLIRESGFVDGEGGSKEPNNMAKRWYGE